MNSATATIATERAWTTRRLAGIVAFIFCAQLALIWLAEEHPKLATKSSTEPISFHLFAAPLKARDIFERIAAPLPDVLALPNEAGFSGNAWLKLKPTHYEPPQWTEPPRWLAYDTKALPGLIDEAKAEHPSLNLTAKIPSTEDVPIFLPQTGQDSSLRVVGPIAARFASPIKLRSWQYDEPLLDDVVEIGVNNAGQVASSRLVSRSGSAEADQKALEISRSLKFSPINKASSALSFGKAIFRWETLPLPTTNAITPEVRR